MLDVAKQSYFYSEAEIVVLAAIYSLGKGRENDVIHLLQQQKITIWSSYFTTIRRYDSIVSQMSN